MTTRYLLSLMCLAVLPLSGALPAQPPAAVDPEPRLSFRFGQNMRFGLTVLKDGTGKAVNKRLTYSGDGDTNSTVLKIDDKVIEFGGPAGKWLEKDVKFSNGSKSVWAVDGIHVSQILEIVPSQQPVEVAPGVRKRLLDTCLIRYVIENKGDKNHAAGLRIQVDTLIGSNDGVPFAVPTLKELVNTFKDFPTAKDVPEFVQALEVPNLQNPGTVGHMTLKLGGGLELPSRVSLTRWPRSNFVAWDVPLTPMGTDSAVVIYWSADHVLRPNDKRELGFAYGLGSVSSGEGTGKLALTVNGSFRAEEPFTVTAYVQNPVRDQTVTLELPSGLERVEGKATEPAPPPTAGAKETSIINWKVRAERAGQYLLKVRSSTGVEQSQPVTIQAGVIPDGGKLLLAVSGPLAVGKIFTLTATVEKPLPKQKLTLTLPAGLERLEGKEEQTVTGGDSSVVWKVKAQKAGDFTLRVLSSPGNEESKAIKIVGPKTDVDLLDARRALQMSVGNLAEDLILDMDGDGRVTSTDAAIILQRVADQIRKGK